MPVLKIPSPLAAACAEGRREATLHAQLVPEAIAEIRQQYPRLYEVLFDQYGALHGFANLYLNQTMISARVFEAIPLAADDVLEVIVSISGG